MKKEEKAALSSLTREELLERCKAMGDELMRLRFRKASGQLDKPHLMRVARRDLARAMTALKQRFPFAVPVTGAKTEGEEAAS